MVQAWFCTHLLEKQTRLKLSEVSRSLLKFLSLFFRLQILLICQMYISLILPVKESE